MKKKTVFMILILCAMLLCASPVYALNIASCSNSIKGAMIDEKIPNIVSTIITVIKIVVPVLLVIFGMLDLAKGITSQKEDEIKKGRQMLVKRLITGALVFFVVTIVQLVVSFVADDSDNLMSCSKCFITGNCTYLKENGSCPQGTTPTSDGQYCQK